MIVRFGRRRPAPGVKKLRLAKYLNLSALPVPPAKIDYTKAASRGLKMILGNDQLGDCTCAGLMHIEDIFRANAKSGKRPVTQDETVWLYSAACGYVPGDPSTDQGGDEVAVLNFARDKGLFKDGSGKIAGYVAIDATSDDEMRAAAWLFGNLYFGVELPNEWVDPFPAANGFVWDVASAQNPSQGHCFIAGGYDDLGYTIDTWGLLGTLTPAAAAMYAVPAANGEAHAVLSEDWINKASGKAPSGFDFEALAADLAAMQGDAGRMRRADVVIAPSSQ